MSNITQEEAQKRLREHGGYDWLLTGHQFWSVSEVVASLAGEGMKVSNDAVARWFKSLPHTQDFGGPVGLRASRLDLILFFGAQMRGITQQVG
jgi:hypothetical protein